MRRRALLLTGASAALAACAGAPGGEPMRREAPRTGGFDVDLYRALAADGGNQFVSPFSVASAFALLYPGARGETAGEFVDVFGFDPSPAAQAETVRTLAEALKTETDGTLLSIADAAWVERTMGLRPEYAALIADQLGATIEAVDFIADQPAALARINAWASSETSGRVPEILTSENPDRRLVLTNAVYFKGRWADEFYEELTLDGEFHSESGAAVPARLMRKETFVPYFEDDGVQVADFDYVGGEFALAVFLPRDRDGLAAFERRLTRERLEGWLRRLGEADRAEREDLDVTFPKVELTADYELGPRLQALGLTRAFSPAADLSGVTDEASLMVSAVFHRSFLAIDEQGTEAAAVTAVDIVLTSGRIPGERTAFKADHPFFIVLRHKPTATPLFLGRIATV